MASAQELSAPTSNTAAAPTVNAAPTGAAASTGATAATNASAVTATAPVGTENAPLEGNKKRNVSDRTYSKVWEHFSFIEGSDPKLRRAKCNHCGQDYACASKKDGTSNLWGHLNKLCKVYKPPIEDTSQKTLAQVGFGGEDAGAVKAICYSYDACRQKLADMIIMDELPFKVVEGVGFKTFCQYMQPKFVVPSRITVARDCLKHYVEEKNKLKNVVRPERLCLTTDTWTSVQNINYMCLTGHWVDSDWKLNKRILNFCQVPDHRGETIAKVLESCLTDWGIDKILTITVDNATSNDGAINSFRRRTRDWRHNVLDHEFLHVRCCAHILNLIVCDGLKDLHDSIVMIRNVVKYVRSSPARLRSFRKTMEKLKVESKSGVCLDVPTRWNSTFLMLEQAEKFEKVFNRLEEDDAKYVKFFLEVDAKGNKKNIGPPGELDWNNARMFIKFLQMFYNVTLKFSGSSYITCNSFFQDMVSIQTKLSGLSKSGDSMLKAMAFEMLCKFDKYWGRFEDMNPLLFVAVLLDPRYKLVFVRFCFSKMYDSTIIVERETKKVKDVFVRICDHYSSLECTAGASFSTSNQAAQEISSNQGSVEEQYALDAEFQQHLMDEDSEEGKSEVEKYLSLANEASDASFDILQWWKINSTKFPTLSKVARDVLAIPISTVASESAFSTSGRILDPFRSSLTPATVEALICCHNWLRATPAPINFQEAMDDITKFETLESETGVLTVSVDE